MFTGFLIEKSLIQLNILFQNPLTTIDTATKKCSLSYKAAYDQVRLRLEKQIEEEMTAEVKTKALNQAVRRNIERFPEE